MKKLTLLTLLISLSLVATGCRMIGKETGLVTYYKYHSMGKEASYIRGSALMNHCENRTLDEIIWKDPLFGCEVGEKEIAQLQIHKIGRFLTDRSTYHTGSRVNDPFKINPGTKEI